MAGHQSPAGSLSEQRPASDAERRVVLVCGPPGAGKSTYARQLGLKLFDLDDPEWNGSERVFRAAISQLRLQPGAQAVVIRAGATVSARRKATELIGATEVKILTTDPDTCIERIVHRKRPRPPLRTQIASVKTWWQKYGSGQVERPPSRWAL